MFYWLLNIIITNIYLLQDLSVRARKQEAYKVFKESLILSLVEEVQEQIQPEFNLQKPEVGLQKAERQLLHAIHCQLNSIDQMYQSIRQSYKTILHCMSRQK